MQARHDHDCSYKKFFVQLIILKSNNIIIISYTVASYLANSKVQSVRNFSGPSPFNFFIINMKRFNERGQWWKSPAPYMPS